MAGQLEAAFFSFPGLVKTTTVSCAKIHIMSKHISTLYFKGYILHPNYCVQSCHDSSAASGRAVNYIQLMDDLFIMDAIVALIFCTEVVSSWFM